MQTAEMASSQHTEIEKLELRLDYTIEAEPVQDNKYFWSKDFMKEGIDEVALSSDE